MEDKREVGTEDLSQILQRARMGQVEDRQKNVGGRAMGEQNS